MNSLHFCDTKQNKIFNATKSIIFNMQICVPHDCFGYIIFILTLFIGRSRLYFHLNSFDMIGSYFWNSKMSTSRITLYFYFIFHFYKCILIHWILDFLKKMSL